MLFNNKGKGDENMRKMDYLIFRIGLGIILMADIVLFVIVGFGIYIGAL